MCRVANHRSRLPRATSSLALDAPSLDAFTTYLGNLFQCITTLWVKNFLLISNLNLPCPSWKPFPLVLSLSTLINSCSPSCLYVPFKYWKATMRSPWSLLFSKLNKMVRAFLQRGFSSCVLFLFSWCEVQSPRAAGWKTSSTPYAGELRVPLVTLVL